MFYVLTYQDGASVEGVVTSHLDVCIDYLSDGVPDSSEVHILVLEEDAPLSEKTVERLQGDLVTAARGSRTKPKDINARIHAAVAACGYDNDFIVVSGKCLAVRIQLENPGG